MEKFILLIICLVGGAALRRSRLFDDKSPIVLNNLLIYFFIPVLTLYYVPKIHFEYHQIWLSLSPFIIYLSSFIFIKLVNTIQSIDIPRESEGALIMSSGIGSISFVGFPVFELLYGSEGLAYGIILSLAGSFVVFNTVGLYTGIYYSEKKKVSMKYILKRMFKFPPFVAFLTAIGIHFSGIQYPHLVETTLLNLSAPFSVLALLAIGMQMDFSLDLKFMKLLFIGQFHKLIIAPLLIYVIMWQILGMTDLVAKVCILGAAIGSMNAISIVAAQKGLHPKLAIAMPAIGIPISIPLLFLIDLILQ